MSPRPLVFADSLSTFDEADFVIVGVPFDRTSSFRGGSRDAPQEIRKASHNFEPYMYELDIDLRDSAIHDMGDLDEMGSTEDMIMEMSFVSEKISGQKKFPLIIGGEHSISPPAASGSVSRFKGDIGIIVVDAHLDFRREYMGDGNNHACASRRFSDMVGPQRVFPIGTRSMCREEMDDAEEGKLRWLSASEANRLSPSEAVSRAVSSMGVEKLYLSIDVDGMDPAFAPGTGTPEPFGLSAVWVKELIRACGPFLAGFDIVEVCPPVDNGNTSALAARLIRETIASVEINGRPGGKI